MKNLKDTVIALHKYLGTAMSFLFLMWCATGFVLLFVGFPHASRQERYIHLTPLPDASLEKILPLAAPFPQGVSLQMCNDRPVYRIKKGRKSETIIDAQTLAPIHSFNRNDCQSIALNFCDGNITSSETINDLDTWIPWSYYKPLLPFYKFYYDDDAHSVVYVSSVIGSVVQHTTRHTRWMARIGAIPHWVYFKQIKGHDGLYKTLITVLGIIGFLACLSGFILGLIRMRRDARGRITALSVYKKRMYKYHHVLGLFIGLFLSAYILSGIFYTTGVPSWMIAQKEGRSAYSQWNKESNIAINPVSSFYHQLPHRPELRQISWGETMGTPVIKAYYTNYKVAQVFSIDAQNTLHPFSCNEKDIMQLAKRHYPTSKATIALQESYDYYYQANGMHHHPLPVYRLMLNNRHRDALYIDPHTGKAVESFNRNKRVRRVLTKTLHKLELPILYRYNTLRIIVSIIVLLFCTIVSYTALVLGLRSLKRSFRR